MKKTIRTTLLIAFALLICMSSLISCDEIGDILATTPQTTPDETLTNEPNETENNVPETDAPETNIPETNSPETDAPETDAPETDPPVQSCTHTYGQWKTTKKATCTSTGTKKEICPKCSKTLSTETIAKLGHDLTQYEGKAATCTEKGYNAYEECSRCDYTTYKKINAKGHSYDNGVCTTCGGVDPNYVPPLETIVVNPLTNKQTSISKITHKSTTIDAAVLKTYNGNITKENQKDVYSFKAPRTGTYRIEITNMREETDVGLYVFDNLGKEVDHKYAYDNGAGITVYLTANKTYEIQVREYDFVSGDPILGSYTLNIWNQKSTIDVTDYTIINDSIEFNSQRNKYTFTPSISGTYRIEITNMREETDVGLYVFDNLGKEVDHKYAYDNGAGITVYLTANKTYEIQVREYDFVSGAPILGSYTLNIWNQKATVDVTSYTKISDSTEFNDQLNKYTFTPSVSGTYRIEITDKKASTYVYLYIYDSLDNRIDYEYITENGDGITVKLTANNTYEIQIEQVSGSGSYALNIWNQKPTVDVTSKVQIKDSIQYTDQENIYNFTVDVTGTQTVKITGLDSSVTTKIYIYNELDETVTYDSSFKNNESITLKNLEVGTNYRIVVMHYSGTGNYTLTIE